MRSSLDELERSDLEGLERELASVLVENTLLDEVQWFREHAEAVHYVDRHVLEVLGDVAPLAIRIAACRAALDLAREWGRDRATLCAPDILMSEPYALIDDSWIRGEDNAPPPHVIVCIARDAGSFRPANYNVVATPRTSSGHAMIDALLDGTVRLGRIEPDTELDPDATSGTWVLEPA